MIVYTLKCGNEHEYEAWFQSLQSYQEQEAAGFLECPHCGTFSVQKVPSASNVITSKALAPQASSLRVSATDAQVQNLLQKFMTEVAKTCEDVGQNFAEEARKIHYGEAPEKNILGETSPQEAQALRDEGIAFLNLPKQQKEFH